MQKLEANKMPVNIRVDKYTMYIYMMDIYIQVNKLQLCAATWINYVSVMLKKRINLQNNASWSKQTQENYIFKDVYIGNNSIKKK